MHVLCLWSTLETYEVLHTQGVNLLSYVMKLDSMGFFWTVVDDNHNHFDENIRMKINQQFWLFLCVGVMLLIAMYLNKNKKQRSSYKILLRLLDRNPNRYLMCWYVLYINLSFAMRHHVKIQYIVNFIVSNKLDNYVEGQFLECFFSPTQISM